MAANSGPRGGEGEEEDDGCQKTRWPPLQGHVVRRERKRMMAARKQDGRHFRPRGEEGEEEDDGC